jgi:hypothetical protein
MAAPVLQNATLYRGADTKSGAAGINLAAPMLVSGEVTSWSITQIGGTVGHWSNTATDGTCPTPNGTGDTANLNGGPYVFSVTATNADGTSAAATLTIEIRANTFTISKRSELIGVVPLGGDSRASLIAGKTLEFARYSTDLGVDGAGAITFKFWRATEASPMLVMHEDYSDPCPLARIVWRHCAYLDFVSIRVTEGRRTTQLLNSYASEKNFSFEGGSTTGAVGNINIRLLDTFGPCGVDGPTDPTLGLTALYFGTGPVTGFEAYNFECYGISNGIFQNTNLSITATFHGRTVLRRISANGLRLSGAPAVFTMHFDHLVVMSPTIDSYYAGVHVDVFQPDNGSDVSGLTIDLLQGIVADGNLGAMQGIFSGNEADPSKLGVTIGAAELVIRNVAGMSVAGFDATHLFSARHVTILKQISGPYGFDTYNAEGELISANSPQYAFDPNVLLNAAMDAAHVTFEKAWVYGQALAPTGAIGSTVIQNFDDPDVSAYFPNAAWICSPTLASTIAANGTVQNYMGVDDSRWHGTVDEVLAYVAQALTPVEGGALMNPDGTYNGSRFPDGTLNDGSVYASSGAPTTVTITPELTTVTQGAPFVVQYVLNSPATEIVTITPGSSGVAGSYSAATVAIPVGQTAASLTFTPTATGSLTLSATDDRGLTGPTSVVVTVQAVSPTTFALSLDRSVTLRNSAVTVFVLLDADATEEVTITLNATGLTGAFSAGTAVIPVGQRAASVTYTPTAVSTGSISATDNRGLTDPSAVPLQVAQGNATRGNLRRLGIRAL